VERKNWTIQEVARTMMMEANISHVYWREAVSTAVYTLNPVQIKGNTSKTPYELWFGHTPTMKYFRIFSSKCYIKRDEDLGKFDARCDEGIFLGYSNQSQAYQCFNKRLKRIVESANVKVDESKERPSKSCGYELDDQNESLNEGKKVQTQTQIEIALENPVTQEASANVEEQVQESEVQENPKTPRYGRLNYSEDQIVDIFTKPLPKHTFEYLRVKLGVITHPIQN